MKLRIGKLEGDLRTNKKLRESMDKHIRMLENALRKRNQEAKGQISKSEPGENADEQDSRKASPKLNGL